VTISIACVSRLCHLFQCRISLAGGSGNERLRGYFMMALFARGLQSVRTLPYSPALRRASAIRSLSFWFCGIFLV